MYIERLYWKITLKIILKDYIENVHLKKTFELINTRVNV